MQSHQGKEIESVHDVNFQRRSKADTKSESSSNESLNFQ